MKKLFAALLAVVACFSLVACKKDSGKTPARTYVADGKYVAFNWQNNGAAPQVTWVTVEIKDDVLVDVDIDCRQGKVTAEGVVTWNEKTKKELGWDYKMFAYTPGIVGQYTDTASYKAAVEGAGKLEWFQQAELVEKFILANGTAAVQLGEKVGGEAGNLYYQNVTNVSIADNEYVALAEKAIANAKAGKVVTFATEIYSGTAQIDFATAVIDSSRKIQSVVIDCIQSKTVSNAVVWSEKTKQELGWDYKMFAYTPGIAGQYTDTASYKAVVEGAGKLEWFQQVELIAKHWLAGGSMELDASNKFVAISSVSIQNNEYVQILDALVSKMACAK